MKELPEHLQDLEPVGDLGTLHIRPGDPKKDGTCNFCTNSRSVHILRGRNLEMRLCNLCLSKIKNYKPE